MIRKVVNSYDVHVHGQLIRMVQGNEVRCTAGDYDMEKLLLNEPRGSKYMNLLVYDIEKEKLHVTVKTHFQVHNCEILLKGLVNTLIERGGLPYRDTYEVIYDEENIILSRNHLNISDLSHVDGWKGAYAVDGRMIGLLETEVVLSIENISEIKRRLTAQNDWDYTVYLNGSSQVVIDGDGEMVAHPVHEVLSVLHEQNRWGSIRHFNGAKVDIDAFEREYGHPFHFISNSQFYIDDTDIYTEGFIIK
ncbi:hypothetical protein [Salinicoccus bachuensis]|uniref:Uncharacterized protein n=1 Tax=Salinicoccus bachuensis TaxID=3136731 RepID=A0ABZ3CM60_9STAP